MLFVAILNIILWLFHNNVASFELYTKITDNISDLELNIDVFSQIVGSESPQKVYESTSSSRNNDQDLNNDNNTNQQQLNFMSSSSSNSHSDERNEATVQESHTSVLCDTDKNKTGGDRKKKLISAGVDMNSVTTILNNENRTCYIVHMTHVELHNVSKHYNLLPLSSTMKLRPGTVNRITDKNRLSPVVIECLNFKSKKILEHNMNNDTNTSTTSEAEQFREKVMGYTKKDILGQAILYEFNEEESSFDEKIDNSTEISDICANSYEYVKFSSIDENLVNNLIKMEVDATEMEKYILNAYSSNRTEISSTMIPKDIFETCILTLIMSMSRQPEVCSIEIEPQYKLFNDHIQYLVQSSSKSKHPWYDVGLNGRGEVVALSDAGIDVNNCYFWDSDDYLKPGANIDLNQRKIVQYDNYADNGDLDYGHGTHVAGTICGKRSVDGVKESSGIADGIAFESKIAFIDIGDPNYNIKIPSVSRLLNVGRPYAKIHSASWGIDFGQYDSRAAQIDAYLNQNDDFIIVVAAGNAGSNNKFKTIASPAVAKNVIAVGASEAYGSNIGSSDMLGPSYIAGFSSKGPTADGRAKPDIIAPGLWVISAGSQTKKVGECDPSNMNDIPGQKYEGKHGLLSMAGTSQATPAVSGVLAMIRQYFREGFYPTGERTSTNQIKNPSGALLKAVLLNGGQPLTAVNNKPDDPSAYPKIYPSKPYDNIQNMGRVSLSDSLYIKDKSNSNAIVLDRILIKEGKTMKFKVKVYRYDWCKSNAFSVTLVWMDKPGFTNCIDSCLINDLDLYVMKSNNPNQIWYPNGKNTKDSKNTAERVRIYNDLPNGESFHVYVKAANFDSHDETQAFALVATGCILGEGQDLPVPREQPQKPPTKSPILYKPPPKVINQPKPTPIPSRRIKPTPIPSKKIKPTPIPSKKIVTPSPIKKDRYVVNTPLPTKNPTVQEPISSSSYSKSGKAGDKEPKSGGKEKYFGYDYFEDEQYSKERVTDSGSDTSTSDNV